MRNRLYRLICSLAVGGFALAAGTPAAHAAAVYAYTGTAFTVKEPVAAPAPLGSHITAVLTFAAPLPANAIGYCIGVGCVTAQPIFWDVNIGLAQHLRSDNADFPANFSPFLNLSSLSTNALGDIVQWSLEFDERNFNGQTIQFGVLSSVISNVLAGTPVYDVGGVDLGGMDSEWGSVAAGAWSTVAQAVPLPSTHLLVLIGFAGLAVTQWSPKRRKPRPRLS